MALVFFSGDEERGINVWRRWFNAHVTPGHMGAPIQPAVSTRDNGGGIEWLDSSEKNQLEGLDYLKENKVEGMKVWWMDAGWYQLTGQKPGNEPHWVITGTWKPDPARYPGGLGPVGKVCKEAGMDFLVWFEPERVRVGTELADEHPEWMLKTKEPQANMLLNLADPACVDWITNRILSIIKESGINCYRQDFNFEPLNFWRDNESSDRRGMLENQYIQGYLRFWDTLLLSEKDLWIDSCASGGRRNDLETMRRAVPLHPTDYGYGYHHINQAFRHTLYSWIPYVRGWNDSWDRNNEYYEHPDYYAKDAPSIDNFALINAFAVFSPFPGVPEMRTLEDQLPYISKMAKMHDAFGLLAYLGDFYALTENHRDNKKWTVFQFNRHEEGKGAFQVLRNNQAKEESIIVYPRDLDKNSEYNLCNEESGESRIMEGREAMSKGIVFSQPVRSGSIWFYERKK
jgi:alpha-galactosidase